MQEKARLAGAQVARLREDAAGPRVGILQERGRVSFEIQGVLPPEGDRLLRLDADDVVAEGAQADRLGDRPPSWLGQVLAASGDLREGALDRLVDEVVDVDDDALPRRHAALREADEGIVDRLRGPVDPHELEGRLESLEAELLILPEDVDRAIAPFHLAQVIREVPRRVERRPAARHEEVLRGVALEPEAAEVEIMGAVLLLAQGEEALDDAMDAAVQDEVALPEERVERDAEPRQDRDDAIEDAVPDRADRPGELRVAALEAIDEGLDLLPEGGILLQERIRPLVQSDVSPFDPLFRLILGGRLEVGDGPVQQDHLLADIVHVILPLHGMSRVAEEATEGVSEERVAGTSDVERASRIHARMFQEYPFRPCGRGPVPIAHQANRGQDEFGKGGRVDPEVDVRPFRAQRFERRHGAHASPARGDVRRRGFQFLGPGMGREGKEAAALGGLFEGSRRLDVQRGLNGPSDPFRHLSELGPRVVAHHVTRNRRMAAMPPNARRRSCPSSESFEMSSTFVPICAAIIVRSSMSSRLSTTVSGPPSFGHVGSSPASSMVFSPSQSPFAHRNLARAFRSPSETKRVSTAPSRRAFRTWSSP